MSVDNGQDWSRNRSLCLREAMIDPFRSRSKARGTSTNTSTSTSTSLFQRPSHSHFLRMKRRQRSAQQRMWFGCCEM